MANPYLAGGQSAAGGLTSVTQRITHATGLADGIIVSVVFGGTFSLPTVSSVPSDTQGNVYELVREQTTAVTLYVWVAQAPVTPLGTSDSVTLSWSGATAGDTDVQVIGTPGTPLLDTSALANGSGTSASASATPSGSGENAVGLFAWGGAGGSGSISSPFTEITQEQEGSSSYLISGYDTNPAGGVSLTGTATFGTATSWTAVLVLMKGVPVAGPVIRPPARPARPAGRVSPQVIWVASPITQPDPAAAADTLAVTATPGPAEVAAAADALTARSAGVLSATPGYLMPGQALPGFPRPAAPAVPIAEADAGAAADTAAATSATPLAEAAAAADTVTAAAASGLAGDTAAATDTVAVSQPIAEAEVAAAADTLAPPAAAAQLAETAAAAATVTPAAAVPLPADAAAAADQFTATQPKPVAEAAAAGGEQMTVTVGPATADAAAAADTLLLARTRGAPLSWQPPPWDGGNVLYGTGLLFTAPEGTALPAAAQLGNAQAWSAAGWDYAGATVGGVQVTRQPTVAARLAEGEMLPLAVGVTADSIQVTTSLSEDTLASLGLAFGAATSQAVTPPAAGQPGMITLTLSYTRPVLAAAILARNRAGYARVLYVPQVQPAGTVQIAYRRAAAQRAWPVTLNAVCDYSAICWADLTGPATS